MNVCITGGAGFIGTNAAAHYLKKGDTVTLFDNLSRKGTDKNLAWLQSLGGKLHVVIGDIGSFRDVQKLHDVCKSADLILHLAAQVAVTTSIMNPRQDFDTNVLGTFNILELMRLTESKAKFIYSSTNKVYGAMEDIEVIEEATRYRYKDSTFRVNEERKLDFHSPYGCSKGSADQYVHDYGRIYDLDTVVMRQSCIYGPRQFGVEDQGWIVWFMIALERDIDVSIYGDGKQVRDLLYIDDLLVAYDKVCEAAGKTRAGVYNIGGGPQNTLSVWAEFGPILECLYDKTILPTFHKWRQGDQKIYISDIRKAKKEFDWEPKIEVREGINKLYRWIQSNSILFQ